MKSVVVIGAGPYGLSVAAHLRRAGVDARVFGSSMSAWRDNMPEGMFLKSEPDASSLSAPDPGSTLHDYCALIGRPRLTNSDPVPIELFVDYGLWFAQRHVPDVEPEIVTRLSRVGGEFDVELASGETTRHSRVVVASGHVAYSYVPPELHALAPDGFSPDALVSHASQHSTFAKYAGRRVAVVGRGQSALESAALLNEAGAHVTVLVRANEVLWNSYPDEAVPSLAHRLRVPPSGLGRGWKLWLISHGPQAVRVLPESRRLAIVQSVLGPAGAWWLRDRLEGHVDFALNCRLAATAGSDGTVRLGTGGSGTDAALEVDHVLAATGYHVDLGALPFLDDALQVQLRRVAGAPQLNGSFESSAPGLYFTGLAAAPTFGSLLRFVYGTGFSSRRISRALAKSSGARAA